MFTSGSESMPNIFNVLKITVIIIIIVVVIIIKIYYQTNMFTESGHSYKCGSKMSLLYFDLQLLMDTKKTQPKDQDLHSIPEVGNITSETLFLSSSKLNCQSCQSLHLGYNNVLNLVHRHFIVSKKQILFPQPTFLAQLRT